MLSLLAHLLLVSTATAAPSLPDFFGGASCKSFTADVTASATNIDLASVLGGPPANQQALTQLIIEQYTTGSDLAQRVAAAPPLSVSGTYSIAFEYCAPRLGTPKGLFQTHHGLVGNAAYWNAQPGLTTRGDKSYSFANAAASAGWATLSYDRLGVGKSAHPDGLQVVQMNYEIAQSIAISQALRAGKLGNIGKFSKIVGVGHSYGSILLSGVASVAPNTFAASILTGYSNNVTTGPLGLFAFQSTIASVAYPSRFGRLSNAYVITPTVSADQTGFFHYPDYTQPALDQFTKTKGEYSLGQQISIAGPFFLSRPNYNKPTLVITGNRDAIFCASDCTVSSLGDGRTQLDTARVLFPDVPADKFQTTVIPETGHGINFSPHAADSYAQIIAFLKKVGVA